MLKTFFEKELDSEGTPIDNGVYFQDRKIISAGEKYTKHMGQYPVIFLSLKSTKQLDICRCNRFFVKMSGKVSSSESTYLN